VGGSGERGDGSPCGCPVGAQGWTTRLRGIQRLGDVPGEGLSLSFHAIAPALDETLPGRFGGGPGDYQLIEDEGPGGDRRLRLLVHPGVGPVDPRAVAEALVSILGHRPASGSLTVERRVPLATDAGKVLHVHRTGDGLGRPG
jgi:hypothetical protein